MQRYRIAIVGPKDAVAGFALLGVHVAAAQSAREAAEILLRFKKELRRDDDGIERNAYGIVFVSEEFLSELSADEEKKLARGALPAIVPLPSHRGATGFGQKRLKRIVERAIGSDILQ